MATAWLQNQISKAAVNCRRPRLWCLPCHSCHTCRRLLTEVPGIRRLPSAHLLSAIICGCFQEQHFSPIERRARAVHCCSAGFPGRQSASLLGFSTKAHVFQEREARSGAAPLFTAGKKKATWYGFQIQINSPLDQTLTLEVTLKSAMGKMPPLLAN